MAHHSKDYPDQHDTTRWAKKIKDMQSELETLDRWPRGMMTEHDEGALAYSVGSENGKVVVMYPKPIAWVGLEPRQALEFGQSLIKHARKQMERKPKSKVKYPY